MKKWIIMAVLAAMLLALSACTNPQAENPTDPIEDPTEGVTLPSYEAEEPPIKGGVYQITEPAHLTYMAQHPDQRYALADDIDMFGYTWTPIDDFSGALTGLIAGDFSYTISNLVIEAKEGDTNVGFFRTVSGNVHDLNFHNISVTCPGTFTGNLGLVAGTSKTAMADVEVKDGTMTATVKDANVGLLCGKMEKDLTAGCATGTMDIKLSGGTSYVGGGVGYTTASLSNSEIRTNVTVEGNGTAGAVGGMGGYIKGAVRSGWYIGHLKVTGDATLAAGTMAGELGTGISNSYDCARSFTRTGAVTADTYCGKKAAGCTVTGCLRRDNFNIEDNMSTAERQMRQKVVDYAYQMATYRWIPSKTIQYTDTCSSGHPQTYQAGTIYFGQPYTHWSSSLSKFQSYIDENHMVSEDLGTDMVALQQLGNDCADFVFWAWNQVEADIKFTLTGEAICANGVQPVGNFEVNSIVSTKEICTYNGKQALYEAYAQARMGDALLVNSGSANHFRLVAENAYVFRNPDGSIDPAKSYIVTHEQGAAIGGGRTTCKVNGKYTFSALYGSNYIPVTVEAYAKGEADVLTAEISNKKLDKSGIGTGIISSNYQIDSVTMRILDSRGKVVVEAEEHGCSSNIVRQFAMSKFRNVVKALQLEAGKEYTYEVFVENGDQKLCVQTYKFTA